jgi:hypothetical protein
MGFFNRVKKFFTGSSTRKVGQKQRLLNSPKSRTNPTKRNKGLERRGMALPPVKPENNWMSYNYAYSPIVLPEANKKNNKRNNETKNKRNRNLNKIRGIRIGPAPPSAAPRVMVPKLAPPPAPIRRRGTQKSNQAKAPPPVGTANMNLINFFSGLNAAAAAKPVASGPKITRNELEALYAANAKAGKGVFGNGGPSEPPTFDLPKGMTREENERVSREFLNQLKKAKGPAGVNPFVKKETNPFNTGAVNPFNQFSTNNPFNQFDSLPTKSTKQKGDSFLKKHFNKYKRNNSGLKTIQKKLNVATKRNRLEKLQRTLNTAKRRGYPTNDIKKIEADLDVLGKELQV